MHPPILIGEGMLLRLVWGRVGVVLLRWHRVRVHRLAAGVGRWLLLRLRCLRWHVQVGAIVVRVILLLLLLLERWEKRGLRHGHGVRRGGDTRQAGGGGVVLLPAGGSREVVHALRRVDMPHRSVRRRSDSSRLMVVPHARDGPRYASCSTFSHAPSAGALR